MFFVIFWTALVRYTWLSNSSRFFFRQSILSDVFGLNGRHYWQLRAVAKVWEQRCGAGGCRREATWICCAPFRTFQLGIRCAEIYVQTVDQFVSTRRRLNFTWCSWAAWFIVKQLERDTALQTLLPPRDDMHICKQYSKQKSKIKQPLWWG